jgi:arabinose-5-phosphate isomerase
MREKASELEIIDEYFSLVSQEIEIFRKYITKDSLNSLVRELNNSLGPIVFLGIGASEIIARRAQHLFNTIGKPSIAPSISDLLHGGIGGLELSNSIVIFSKSGQTEEILRLLNDLSSHNYNIFLITENDKLSTSETPFYRQILCLGSSIESDLNRVLPTTSNIKFNMVIDMLTRGLQNYHDSSLQLSRNHPGGTLGKMSNLTLAEVLELRWTLRFFSQNSSVKELLQSITEDGIGGISVTDSASFLIGIVSDGDLRRILARENLNLTSMKLDDITKTSPIVLYDDMPIDRALEVVNKHGNVSFFPIVTRENRFRATISSREILTLRFGSN